MAGSVLENKSMEGIHDGNMCSDMCHMQRVLCLMFTFLNMTAYFGSPCRSAQKVWRVSVVRDALRTQGHQD